MSPAHGEATAQPHTRLTDRIFVPHSDRLLCILIKDISCIVAERSYCRLFTTGGSYLLCISLGVLERKLRSPSLLRVHRSYLVNLAWIREIDGNCLRVDNRSIPVARGRMKQLEERLLVIS